MENYDTALVCMNGHMINDEMRQNTHRNRRFCPDCGAAGISECPHCNSAIRGALISEVVIVGVISKPDRYCGNCGQAFPWTDQAIQSAVELLAETLPDESEDHLRTTIQELTRNTPKTEVAVHRMRKLLQRSEGRVSEAVQQTLINVISHPIAKQIWDSFPS